MIIEFLLVLLLMAFCLIFFGHMKGAYIGFVGGGMIFMLAMLIVAYDGIEVNTAKLETSNFTAPYAWSYNTTYNFSYFTPSNTTTSTTYVYTEQVPSLVKSGFNAMTAFFLALSFVGLAYMLAGIVMYRSNRG